MGCGSSSAHQKAKQSPDKSAKQSPDEGASGVDDSVAQAPAFERRPSEDSVLSANPEKYRAWTAELEKDLQEAVDRIFLQQGKLADLKFSLTIADPMLDGCPLIGCSSGFGTLCGYEMQEIVGRNCRFLVDPVPKEQIDQQTRDRSREFCHKVKHGSHFSENLPPLEPWMPPAVAGELFCAQTNARKNGDLFKNMFYLVAVELDDQPYILGLQTEMKEDDEHQEACARACKLLSQNRGEVDRLLAKKFWFSGPVRRQDELGSGGADELKP